MGIQGRRDQTFVMFLDGYLRNYAGQVEGSTHTLEGSSAIVRHIRLLKEAPRVFSKAQLQESGGGIHTSQGFLPERSCRRRFVPRPVLLPRNSTTPR